LQLVGTRQALEPSNTRLTLGDYIADVLHDTRHNADIFHWIVQKVGSPTIVQWGQEYTFGEAKSAAQAYLEFMNRQSDKTA
jgi:hypothetical protein